MRQQLDVQFSLKKLKWESGGSGYESKPYLWTVFFKVDGSNGLQIGPLKIALYGGPNKQPPLATVIRLPPDSNNGNLQLQHPMQVGEEIDIPANVGTSPLMRVKPIPIVDPQNFIKQGIKGMFANERLRTSARLGIIFTILAGNIQRQGKACKP